MAAPALIAGSLATNKNSATGAITVTWGATTVAGRFLVAVLMRRAGTGGVLTKPAAWSSATTVLDISGGTNDCRITVLVMENAAAQSGGQAFSWSTGSVTNIGWLMEFSGMVNVSVVEDFDTAVGTSAASGNLVIPAGTADGSTIGLGLAFAAFVKSNSAEATMNTPSGYTQVSTTQVTANATAGNNIVGSLWSKALSAGSLASESPTCDVDGNVAAARGYAGCVLLFKAADQTVSPDAFEAFAAGNPTVTAGYTSSPDAFEAFAAGSPRTDVTVPMANSIEFFAAGNPTPAMALTVTLADGGDLFAAGTPTVTAAYTSSPDAFDASGFGTPTIESDGAGQALMPDAFEAFASGSPTIHLTLPMAAFEAFVAGSPDLEIGGVSRSPDSWQEFAAGSPRIDRSIVLAGWESFAAGTPAITAADPPATVSFSNVFGGGNSLNAATLAITVPAGAALVTGMKAIIALSLNGVPGTISIDDGSTANLWTAGVLEDNGTLCLVVLECDIAENIPVARVITIGFQSPTTGAPLNITRRAFVVARVNNATPGILDWSVVEGAATPATGTYTGTIGGRGIAFTAIATGSAVAAVPTPSANWSVPAGGEQNSATTTVNRDIVHERRANTGETGSLAHSLAFTAGTTWITALANCAVDARVTGQTISPDAFDAGGFTNATVLGERSVAPTAFEAFAAGTPTASLAGSSTQQVSPTAFESFVAGTGLVHQTLRPDAWQEHEAGAPTFTQSSGSPPQTIDPLPWLEYSAGPAPGAFAGKTYFVVAGLATGLNNGTSRANAWRTLAALNAGSVVLRPGDRVELAGNFTGGFVPTFSGLPNAHIELFSRRGTRASIVSAGVAASAVLFTDVAHLHLTCIDYVPSPNPTAPVIQSAPGTVNPGIWIDRAEVDGKATTAGNIGIRCNAADAGYAVTESKVFDTGLEGVMANADGVVITDNQVVRTGKVPGANTPAAISLRGLNASCLRNEVETFTSFGIELRGTGTVSGNWCSDGAVGIQVRPAIAGLVGTAFILRNRCWNTTDCSFRYATPLAAGTRVDLVLDKASVCSSGVKAWDPGDPSTWWELMAPGGRHRFGIEADLPTRTVRTLTATGNDGFTNLTAANASTYPWVTGPGDDGYYAITDQELRGSLSPQNIKLRVRNVKIAQPGGATPQQGYLFNPLAGRWNPDTCELDIENLWLSYPGATSEDAIAGCDSRKFRLRRQGAGTPAAGATFRIRGHCTKIGNTGGTGDPENKNRSQSSDPIPWDATAGQVRAAFNVPGGVRILDDGGAVTGNQANCVIASRMTCGEGDGSVALPWGIYTSDQIQLGGPNGVDAANPFNGLLEGISIEYTGAWNGVTVQVLDRQPSNYGFKPGAGVTGCSDGINERGVRVASHRHLYVENAIGDAMKAGGGNGPDVSYSFEDCAFKHLLDRIVVFGGTHMDQWQNGGTDLTIQEGMRRPFMKRCINGNSGSAIYFTNSRPSKSLFFHHCIVFGNNKAWFIEGSAGPLVGPEQCYIATTWVREDGSAGQTQFPIFPVGRAGHGNTWVWHDVYDRPLGSAAPALLQVGGADGTGVGILKGWSATGNGIDVEAAAGVDVSITNCLVYGEATWMLKMASPTGTGSFREDGNLWARGATGTRFVVNGGATDYAGLRASAGYAGGGATKTAANPLVWTAPDFLARTGSPLRNGGTTVVPGVSYLAGIDWFGTAPDIGADEVPEATIVAQQRSPDGFAAGAFGNPTITTSAGPATRFPDGFDAGGFGNPAIVIEGQPIVIAPDGWEEWSAAEPAPTIQGAISIVPVEWEEFAAEAIDVVQGGDAQEISFGPDDGYSGETFGLPILVQTDVAHDELRSVGEVDPDLASTGEVRSELHSQGEV